MITLNEITFGIGNTALSLIGDSTDTQVRHKLDEATVLRYCDVLIEGGEMSPVVLYSDGESYWIADGFHRVAAYRRCCRDTIPAEVRQGGLRDATLCAVGSNAEHGLARSNNDKERAVFLLLFDEEWRSWSDRSIAQQCRVSPTFVSKVRRSFEEETFPPDEPAASVHDGQIDETVAPTPKRRAKRNGTVYTMNTANIGSTPNHETVVAVAGDMSPVERPAAITITAEPAAAPADAPNPAQGTDPKHQREMGWQLKELEQALQFVREDVRRARRKKAAERGPAIEAIRQKLLRMAERLSSPTPPGVTGTTNTPEDHIS